MKHGCHPFGNAKARAVVWNFPDADPAAPRAALQHRGPTWSPSTRRTTTRRRSGACRRCSRRVQQKNVQDKVAQEIPADPDLGPPGRVRGRRRGDALQPVAGRAAAGGVRRDQPEDGGRPRHPQRRVRLGEDADRRAASRCKALVTERVGPDTVLDAVPLLRLVAGRGHAAVLPGGRGAGRARRGGEHRHDLRLRQRDDDAGNQDHALPGRASRHKEDTPWQE